MKTNKRFFNVASKLFMFALVVVASAALSSCSKDEDDAPPTKPNTIMINRKEKQILRAEWVSSDFNSRRFSLVLSETTSERVEIAFVEDRHLNKDLDLSKREELSSENAYWELDYKGEDGEDLFTTWGKSEAGYKEGSFIYPVFERGMLNISTSDGNHFKVMLKDGRVKGDDGNFYDISINYEGSIEK